MSPVRAPIRVHAGSYEPQYWLITDPTTGDPTDLTAPGYTVTLVVEDRAGTELITLTGGDGLRLTAEGRIYFEPLSSVTTDWAPMRAAYQLELEPPAGPDYAVLIAYGPFSVDYEMIKS